MITNLQPPNVKSPLEIAYFQQFAGFDVEPPEAPFHCIFCNASRECITCWHSRLMKEADTSVSLGGAK